MSASHEDLESDDFETEADNVTDIGSVKRRDNMPRPSDTKIRMSGQERREQLLAVGRKLFAEKGFEAVSVEEIASTASTSDPRRSSSRIAWGGK